MSIWSDIRQFLSTITVDAFSAVIDAVRTFFDNNAEKRRQVAFSVAIIALSAKMAKADGVVTQDEVDAFREFFDIPPKELRNVSRLYNLAKQDVAGFDAYAGQVRSLFPSNQDADIEILTDVVDALFHVAKADGVVHENELLFLEEICVAFEFSKLQFEQIKMRHMQEGDCNPFVVLGVDPELDFASIKSHYRKRVAENHPDRLLARGVPPEFIRIATDRMAALNNAWDRIEKMNRKSEPVASGA